ncbi:twin-arginine translocation signal domain-containing protein [Paraburkholderia madseniana]|uniref:Twin-arginine translocation signal domain-containing protein n=1 Tax=Paraburkholderia madseniana TaxID=2599607 RepID=A0A6N6W276_9BURK|nr:twin-arginine translocation signal domain-containing protein [Paraburkholderia madseniana]KAE8754229.1 twin-arginine translocation signal domain-containing protein [Paraburkholderia madseniana]
MKKTDLIRNETSFTSRIDRRTFLKQTAAAGAALAARPLFARDAGQVVVRGLGGAYQDAMDAAVYKPFTAATGIEVIVQPLTAGQILAMVEAGRVQVDVADLGDLHLLTLEKAGALDPIDYDGMKLTNPSDLRASVRGRNMVGNFYFATVASASLACPA